VDRRRRQGDTRGRPGPRRRPRGELRLEHHGGATAIRTAIRATRRGSSCRWPSTTTALDCAIVGGYVYRGSAYPALSGAYIFGDECTGYIRAVDAAEPDQQTPTTLVDTHRAISSFGQTRRRALPHRPRLGRAVPGDLGALTAQPQGMR
jgi:hypothetical protein